MPAPTDFYYEEDSGIDPEQNSDDFGSHMVFRSEHTIRTPAKGDDDKTYLYITPTFDKANPTSKVGWSWYRKPPGDPEEGKFTNWIRPYFVYEYVGGKKHIISPSSYGEGELSIDPVKILCDTVMGRPEWRHLAGRNTDGKKPTEKALRDELFKSKIIDRATKKFVVNAVNPNRSAEGEDKVSCLYSIPATAVQGSYKKEKEQKVQSWGLFAQLNMLSRNVDPALLAKDFTLKYHWGDITRADGLTMVCIYKESPPTGGAAKMYNMVPAQMLFQGHQLPLVPVPQINGDYPWLSSRVPLTSRSLFIDYDVSAVLNELEDLFIGHADILHAAFDRVIPNFGESLARKLGIVSSSVIHQAGGVPDANTPPPPPAAQSAPPPPPPVTGGAYAPSASAPPPPPPAQTPPPVTPPVQSVSPPPPSAAYTPPAAVETPAQAAAPATIPPAATAPPPPPPPATESTAPSGSTAAKLNAADLAAQLEQAVPSGITQVAGAVPPPPPPTAVGNGTPPPGVG